MLAQRILHGACNGQEKQYVDDVFSTYLYTGNGATKTITNGIDLAGEGGMVWVKRRDAAAHFLADTARGANNILSTNATTGNTNTSGNPSITGFLSNGFSLGGNSDVNGSSAVPGLVSWTFRRAPKFFKCATVVKTAGSNATVDLSSLGTVGMVTVKRTDSTGDWYTWHRSLDSGKLMYLNQTAAAATLGHITVSGTTLTLVNGVIADGAYVVYAWAHDPSADGLIQCGSFTTDASGNATVNLGWEPQFVLYKASSTTSGWSIIDSMRGMPVGGVDANLAANSSNAEDASLNRIDPTATGFVTPAGGVLNSTTYIYLAIRRPNKPPKSGTEAYNAIARTGTDAAATVTGVGFAPDLLIEGQRNSSETGWSWSRLAGSSKMLRTSTTGAEATVTNAVTEFGNDGVVLGTDSTLGAINWSVRNYVNWFFRRAPGFFDVVCYTGTGVARTVAHTLGVVPELMIVKNRNVDSDWGCYAAPLGATQLIYLSQNSTSATASASWNNTTPTSSMFTVGTWAGVNGSTNNLVAYLFATLPGISKVGSYTGNGSSQTINCEFSAGARFILIKRTDSTGDWYVWDSVRGIVAANDPHLSLNTTAAEVTTDDSIDPDSTGFIVNQNTATNINVTGGRYLFLSIA